MEYLTPREKERTEKRAKLLEMFPAFRMEHPDYSANKAVEYVAAQVGLSRQGAINILKARDLI